MGIFKRKSSLSISLDELNRELELRRIRTPDTQWGVGYNDALASLKLWLGTPKKPARQNQFTTRRHGGTTYPGGR